MSVLGRTDERNTAILLGQLYRRRSQRFNTQSESEREESQAESQYANLTPTSRTCFNVFHGLCKIRKFGKPRQDFQQEISKVYRIQETNHYGRSSILDDDPKANVALPAFEKKRPLDVLLDQKHPVRVAGLLEQRSEVRVDGDAAARVERYGSRATVSFVSYSDQNSVKIPSKFRKFNQNSSELLNFKD